MAANNPVHAMTAGELAKNRSAAQFAQAGLWIQIPAVVYSCRIAQSAFTSSVGVNSFAFDGGSGTASDVFNGFTVWIGTGAGLADKGICRLRGFTESAGAGIISIGITSSIVFADNDYVTIVRETNLWQRDATTNGGELRMDFDVAWGYYQNGGAVGRVGGIAAVVFLDATTGEATFNPVDPSLSSCYDGATVAGYHYYCPGATVTDATTTAPLFTFNASGQFLWWVEITDSLGRVTTHYRWVIVSPTSQTFEIVSNPSADYGAGGWSCRVRIHSDLSDVQDRALCVIYTTQEVYGGTVGAIGKLPGYENIILQGWLDKETINVNSQAGYCEVDIIGAAGALSKVRSLPYSVFDATTETSWANIASMTTDKAIARLLQWTTTAASVMDIFLTGSTLRIPEATSPADNVFEQLREIAADIHAAPLTNYCGQLFIEIDAQVLSPADQALLTTVMAITKADYVGDYSLGISTDEKIALLQLSGAVWDGTNKTQVYSRAPGNIPAPHGTRDQSDNFLFEDQDECNQRAGAVYAVRNLDYDYLDFEMAGQNKFFDIAPRQLATAVIDDNPLGLTFTAKLIPRQVEHEFSANGFIKCNVSFEFLQETARDGVTYTPPTPQEENVSSDYDMPDLGDFEVPDFPDGELGDFIPNTIPSIVTPNCNVNTVNAFTSNWDKDEIRGDDTELISRCYFPCVIHGTGGEVSSVEKPFMPYVASYSNDNANDANSNITLYAIKSGTRILTADSNFEFHPAGDTEVDGFEIELNAGLGGNPRYVPLDTVATGTAQALNNQSVNLTGLVVGKYYSIEGIGGPWYAFPVGDPQYLPIYILQAYDTGGYITNSIGYSGVTGTMITNVGARGVRAEAITSLYARAYWLAAEDNVTFRASADPNPGDNTGTISAIVRNARADGRIIKLNSAKIQNVCAVG